MAAFQAQARACLDFEPALACSAAFGARATADPAHGQADAADAGPDADAQPEAVSAFRFEDTTDVFRSYVPEESECRPGVQEDSEAAAATPRQPLRSTAAAVTPVGSLFVDSTTLGGDDGDESARLADWHPLDESSVSRLAAPLPDPPRGPAAILARTLIKGTPVLVKGTPVSRGAGLRPTASARPASEDGDDNVTESSFDTPPSVVLDSQCSNAAAGSQSPLQRHDGAAASSGSPVGRAAIRTTPLHSLPGTAFTIDDNDAEVNDTVCREHPAQVSYDDTPDPTRTRPALRFALRATGTQDTMTFPLSADLDTQRSWQVETSRTPRRTRPQQLSLRSPDATSDRALQSSQSLPPKRPAKSPTQERISDGASYHASLKASRPVSRDTERSFDDFCRSLPLSVAVANARAPSQVPLQTRRTRALDMLVKRVAFKRTFRPDRVVRRLEKSERGHWQFVIQIIDLPHDVRANQLASAQASPATSPHSQPPMNTTHRGKWSLKQFDKFWDYLSRFIASGRAGSGTSCTCEALHDMARPTPEHRDREAGQVPQRSVNVKVAMRTWGELAPHTWVLLYVASDRRIKDVRDVAFRDEQLMNVIKMG
ncbi:hypothetical protein KEM52_005457 [Ascosphaera acerosa]|nr:hypothetical protein KEM52_005457 [Ascosphaera acerosa]